MRLNAEERTNFVVNGVLPESIVMFLPSGSRPGPVPFKAPPREYVPSRPENPSVRSQAERASAWTPPQASLEALENVVVPCPVQTSPRAPVELQETVAALNRDLVQNGYLEIPPELIGFHSRSSSDHETVVSPPAPQGSVAALNQALTQLGRAEMPPLAEVASLNLSERQRFLLTDSARSLGVRS